MNEDDGNQLENLWEELASERKNYKVAWKIAQTAGDGLVEVADELLKENARLRKILDSISPKDRVLQIQPDQNCEFCRGSGEIFDSVDYGSTTAQLPSFCGCVEEQVAEEYEDWDIVLVFPDKEDMYEIVIAITVGEYEHFERHYFYGARELAQDYANAHLQNIWGEGETLPEDADGYYQSKDLTRAAQLYSVEVLTLTVQTERGGFCFYSNNWKIR